MVYENIAGSRTSTEVVAQASSQRWRGRADAVEPGTHYSGERFAARAASNDIRLRRRMHPAWREWSERNMVLAC